METLMLIWILTKGLLGMPRTMPMTKIMVSFASVLFKIEHLIINEHIDVNEIINIILIYLICCTQAVYFLELSSYFDGQYIHYPYPKLCNQPLKSLKTVNTVQ